MRNSLLRIKRILRYLLFIFFVIVILDIAAILIYYRILTDFTNSLHTDFRTDAAVIFYGDGKEGKLVGDDTRNRIEAALELYKNKKIANFICVGGYSIRSERLKEHPIKIYLNQKDIPSEIIFYDSTSFNTITNWGEAQKIIKREKFKNVVLVSAPTHIYRISRRVKGEGIYYYTYKYSFSSLSDLLKIHETVNREFVSLSMDAFLDDETRNKFVFWYRDTFK